MKGISFFGLPVFRQEWSFVGKKHITQDIIDKRTDMLATILAAYPVYSTKKLAKELGIGADTIRDLARIFGLRKSDGYRSAAYTGNDNAPRREVLKTDIEGNIVKEYKSIKEAASDNDCHFSTIKYRCEKQILCGGYYYRYKQDGKIYKAN